MDLTKLKIKIPDEAVVDSIENNIVSPDDIITSSRWVMGTVGAVNNIPTHKCLICDELEDSTAGCVYTAHAWICPKCKSALKQVVDIVNS